MRPERVVCLVLSLVTLALYAQVLGHGFVNFDDGQYVAENPMVQRGLTLEGLGWAFTTSHAANWHPLTWLSHMLDWELFGGWSGGHHLTSVLIHALNAVLVFVLFRGLTGSLWASALLAAFFAWHPLRVESVAWVSERKDVLSTCFGLLALLAYARYARTQSLAKLWVSVAWFALSLMAKPMLVTLPFLLLLLDVWPLNRLKVPSLPGKAPAPAPLDKALLRRLLLEKMPFFALTLASCGVTLWAQRSGGAVVSLETLSFPVRLANAFAGCFGYVEKTFWPFELAIFYPFTGRVPMGRALLGALLVFGVAALALRWWRRAPWLAVGWFWFVGTLVPVIGLVQVGSQVMADRYSYVPCLGLGIVLVWTLRAWRQRRPEAARLGMLGAGAFGLVCLALTHLQVGVWANGVTLFRNAVAVTPANGFAHFNLGTALLQAGQAGEAAAHLGRALELQPNLTDARINLGLALGELGRFEEAHTQFAEVAASEPASSPAHYHLGVSFAGSADHAAARRHLLRAVELAPDDPALRMNVVVLLLKIESPGDAEAQLAAVLRALPDHGPALHALGLARLQQGRAGEAEEAWRRALALRPDDADTLLGLARLLATHPGLAGRNPEEALHMAQRAVALRGNRDPWALDTLAAAQANAGRFEEAVSTASQAAALAEAAGRGTLGKQIRLRLEAYRSHRPWREEGATHRMEPAPSTRG